MTTGAARCVLVVALGILLAAVRAAGAEKEIPGLYAPEVLKHWQAVFQRHVEGQRTINIAPYVEGPHAASLAKVRLSVTADAAAGRLFDFSYDRSTNTVLLPTASIKFLYDTLAAVAWLRANGYDDRSALYLLALKYHDATQFPGGRYLSPLDAFGIPHSRLFDVAFTCASDQLLFEEHFNSAMLFVVGHEIGHALDDGFSQRSAREREEKADLFAAEMLGRTEFSYVGVVSLLANWSTWQPGRADFPSQASFDQWRSSQTEHPTSSDRVRSLGEYLRKSADTLFPPSTRRSVQIARARSLGQELLGAAQLMAKYENLPDIQRAAARIDVAGLHVSKLGPAKRRNNTPCKPLPEEPGTRTLGPPRRIADLPTGDLVRQSGGWWNMTVQEFLAATGLTPGHYASTPDVIDTTRTQVLPATAARRKLWPQPELEPFTFTFDEKLGLVEINGFLVGKKQADDLPALIRRYGPPTAEATALDFITYVWTYDQSTLELHAMGFVIRSRR
jgi:hypothetical protein